MNQLAICFVVIYSSLFTLHLTSQNVANRRAGDTTQRHDTTSSAGITRPFSPVTALPTSSNSTIGSHSNGTTESKNLTNGTLIQDRILGGALGDGSNERNTGFGFVPGVGIGTDGLTNNLAFGQPFGGAGSPINPGMNTGAGSNIIPGYGYGGPGYPTGNGMNFGGANWPGVFGNGYPQGNYFGNFPFPAYLPGNIYGTGLGNLYGPGIGNWYGNPYGIGNGYGTNPWFSGGFFRHTNSDANQTEIPVEG